MYTAVIVTDVIMLLLPLLLKLTATATVGRLLPDAGGRSTTDGRDARTVIEVCRMTAVDLAHQPLALSVFALGAPPAGFLRTLHELAGPAVLMHVPVAAVTGQGQGPDVTRAGGGAGHAVLVIVDDDRRVDAVLELMDSGAVAAWDQLSHYVVWLTRPGAVDEAAVKELFRAAWRRRSAANVAVVAAAAAYTYNPFADALTEQPADAAVLRSVARLRMTDLYGHPVRICMFPTRLKAVKQPDGTYKGMDGIVAATLAKHMNFTAVYSEPSDGRKYGWAKPNSESVGYEPNAVAGSDSNFTYTGLLGDLVHNKVDMAFNGVFLNVINFPPSPLALTAPRIIMTDANRDF